jgi:hypothetical protein
MMSLEGEEIHQSNSGWSPVYVEENLCVMSIAFMLPDQDDPVIWRGPRKNGTRECRHYDRLVMVIHANGGKERGDLSPSSVLFYNL